MQEAERQTIASDSNAAEAYPEDWKDEEEKEGYPEEDILAPDAERYFLETNARFLDLWWAYSRGATEDVKRSLYNEWYDTFCKLQSEVLYA